MITLPPVVSNKQIIAALGEIVAPGQLAALFSTLSGPEAQGVRANVGRLVEVVAEALVARGDSLAYLHYFEDSVDWYIVRMDPGDEGDRPEDRHTQAYGLRVEAGGAPRWCYINLRQVIARGAELDIHWAPKPARAV